MIRCIFAKRRKYQVFFVLVGTYTFKTFVLLIQNK